MFQPIVDEQPINTSSLGTVNIGSEASDVLITSEASDVLITSEARVSEPAAKPRRSRTNDTPLTPDQKAFGEANSALAFSILYRQNKQMIGVVGPDNAISAAGLAYVRTVRKFDPNRKCKLSSSLNVAIKRELWRVAQKQQKPAKFTAVPIEDVPHIEAPSREPAEKAAEAVAKLLGSLNKRERLIIKAYHGIGRRKRYNFVTLGKKLHVSTAWIQAIHAAALKKMRGFVVDC